MTGSFQESTLDQVPLAEAPGELLTEGDPDRLQGDGCVEKT